MALTEDRKALVETILNTLREDPSLLEEFRRLLVPEIVVFLPDLKLIAERQAALEERLTRELSAVWEAINALRAEVAELRQEVRSVAERQERMEKRLDQIEQRQEQMEQRMERMEQRQERMEQRQERMEQRLERMEERQDRMEQRQDRMERRLQRLETDVGHLKGTVKEITYRTNFLGYFGFWVLSAEDPWLRLWEKIEEALQEGMLTQDELTDLRSADLLWLGVLRRGKFAGQEVLIVAEFSWTVQREDVERALRRASLARKAGFWSLPLVAGTEWESAELKNEAIAKGVVCVENGRVDPLDWDTILTLWQPHKGT
jgi:predicted nuclease with TOPRIM domain